MSKRISGLLVASLCGLSFAAPAHADSLSGNFLIKNGGASASGGSVSFSLNGNGTIAASLISFDGGIQGFGFDSPIGYPESGFSVSISNASGWSDMYGGHYSGFSCGSEPGGHCGTSVSWTIGNAGDFSSVWQAISGPYSSYDFFLYTLPTNGSNQWAANAVAAVPEPETYAMLLAGLGLLGLARRRKRNPA